MNADPTTPPKENLAFAEKYLEAVNAWHRFKFFAALIGLHTSAMDNLEADLIRHGAEKLRDIQRSKGAVPL